MDTTQLVSRDRDVIKQFNNLDGITRTIEEYNDTAVLTLRVDGDAWTWCREMMLVEPSVTKIGDCGLNEWTTAEYVGTEYAGDVINMTGYGFRNPNEEHTHYVPAEQVRMLANEVFDVAYETIRGWAKTNEDFRHGDNSPVLFDPPKYNFRVIITPIVQTA